MNSCGPHSSAAARLAKKSMGHEVIGFTDSRANVLELD
mgnify:FL=1